jgi:ubiquinone/menaquinone biosynthesis C-methylase UbiE
MNAYSPKKYWGELAENYDSADAEGLAPVLHPGAPAWFNRLIDKQQFQAVRRAVALAKIPAAARSLDVGCGTGRWVRRYGQLGFRATGLDVTPGMLKTARQCGTAGQLVAGEAYRLPFADGAFDFVSDVTVVQHIPAELQPAAIGEMMRVLKPEGHLLLLELIRGRGAHIFPRSPENWIEQATSHGATLLGWFGQEFLLPDRLFVRMAQTVSGRNGARVSTGVTAADSESDAGSAVRRAYWRFRRITASVSAWTDPFAEKICPARLATHGMFVFRK